MSTFSWTSCTAAATDLPTFLHLIQTCSSRHTALSDIRIPLATIAAYLTLLAIIRPAAFAQTRAFVIIAAAHNILLSVASLVMNIGATYAVYRTINTPPPEGGLAATVCTTSPVEAPRLPSEMQLWMYIFYLSKYYELFDTLILRLRGRPLTLLHVWHHSSVMFETWGWLEYNVTVGIYGMWFNTAVHVIMYAYYACALLKLQFPLKKSITIIQIVQFVTSFTSLIPYTWLYVSNGGCTGLFGLAISAFINGSYLLLFIQFFKNTYAKKLRPERNEKNE